MANNNQDPVDVLVLAAGGARRYGGCKLLAPWLGKPLLEHVLAKALALPVNTVNIVLGGYAAELTEFLQDQKFLRINRFYCQDWAAGLGHSLTFGVAQLSSANAVLILLADQPLVELNQLQKMLVLARANPEKIVCAEFADTLAVPALFPAEFKQALLNLQGDRGAKPVLLENSVNVIKLPMTSAAVDIDLPEDLLHLPTVRS